MVFPNHNTEAPAGVVAKCGGGGGVYNPVIGSQSVSEGAGVGEAGR